MRFSVPAVLVLAVASCHFNVECGAGETRVDRTRANALVKTLADRVDSVTSVECPDNVEAAPGTTFDCTATFADGSRHIAVVTVKSVKGTDIDATATWRTPLLGAAQRALVAKSITDKLGVPVELYCGGRVVAMTVDQRLRCAVRGVERDVPADVWIDAAGDLGWKLNPDAPEAPAGAAEAPPAP